MPIYLCQPGSNSKEPWRHGVQVYERPFPLQDGTKREPPKSPPKSASSAGGGTGSGIDAAANYSVGGYEGGPPPESAPEQVIVLTSPPEKMAALKRYLEEKTDSHTTAKDKILIFCEGKDRGEYLAEGWAKALRSDQYRALPFCEGRSRGRTPVAQFRNGTINILVVDDDAEELLLLDPGFDAHMVVNFDLKVPVERYLKRLKYTSNLMVSFFHPPEEGHIAKDLVGVLTQYGQRVPRELGVLVPPPLMTPRNDTGRGFSRSDATSAEANATNEAEEGAVAGRGRPIRAVPLRGDSHSPVPDPENNSEGRRERQRQFIRNHNITTSQSSDEDEPGSNHGRNVGPRGTTAPGVSEGQPKSPQFFSVSPEALVRPNPVRRVRHAEIVLVDQCLIAYGRTWLRLRWPGEQGGFGGFVALSRVEEARKSDGGLKDGEGSLKIEGGGELHPTGSGSSAEEDVVLCQEVGAPSPPVPPSTTTVAASSSTETSLLCQETGIHYPTSKAMRLLPLYDDGLCRRVGPEDGVRLDESILLENGEPVFCRICREGLHDVNYDLETTAQPAAEEGSTSRGGQAATGGNAGRNVTARADSNSSAATAISSTAAVGGGRDSDHSISTSQQDDAFLSTSALTSNVTELSAPPDSLNHLANLPPIILHHPTAENPLLAPCDCTGTMAFVHYLCVEQWRCRSRHPGARNGLNCETCGAEYTLPPPPSRPASRSDLMGGMGNNMLGEDDWLDAMPPHVLAALRRPHPAWQLGAAVVRRRWLRPIVPIIVSPLVALYCRARRTLKKRGVSRRRWACSLCRRRARWKCVRCLRSYYCSRQCQNVSWHIVHKHVCYKPVRFWWSVVVYTLALFVMVPNIIENFPIYDAMVTLLPINFIALGIVGGGIASALKRSSGIDIRGRILEIIVVLLTCFLTGVSSGLVRGYFGDTSQCWGVLAAESPVLKGPFYPSVLNTILVEIPLKQIQLWYLKWDFIMSKLGFISRRFLCVPATDGSTDYSSVGCSPATRTINPQFYLEEDSEGLGRCSADVTLVMGVWFAALGVLSLGYAYRQVRGAARRNGVAAAAHRGRRRPHQD